MYGINKNDDFTFLVNKHLIQICFGMF